jgi:hypothetical protein
VQVHHFKELGLLRVVTVLNVSVKIQKVVDALHIPTNLINDLCLLVLKAVGGDLPELPTALTVQIVHALTNCEMFHSGDNFG